MTHFSDGVRVGAVFPTFAEPGVAVSPITVYDVAPIALSTTAVAAAQGVGGAVNLVINGASAVAGVAVFDVPRAVQVVSTGAGDTTQTLTVVGVDAYNQPMSEAIALNGTTAVSGQKAFFRVTRVTSSALTAGSVSVGSTDILGLPIAVSTRNYALTAWDGAFVTTGTFAAADATSPATTTSNDVRGTYLPPSATNGTRRLTVYLFCANPNTQAGIYGVTQA